jgi:1,4-dihydroxy-2-naphthoate octaprenyltransferase
MLMVLLALGQLRMVVGVYRQPKPAQPPPEYPEDGWPLWFVAFAFIHNRRFGLLFILGLLIDAILVRLVLN